MYGKSIHFGDDLNIDRCPCSCMQTVPGYHSTASLLWRHNECHGVPVCLFRRRLKLKTSKLRITGLCEGNLPVIGGFLSQRASNAENVPLWWRHHVGTDVRHWLLLSQNRLFPCWVVHICFWHILLRRYAIFIYNFQCALLDFLCFVLMKFSDKMSHHKIMKSTTSHYLKQCWCVVLTHMCVTRPQWVKREGTTGTFIEAPELSSA